MFYERVPGHGDRLSLPALAGWAVAEHMRTDLIGDALVMARRTAPQRPERDARPMAVAQCWLVRKLLPATFNGAQHAYRIGDL